MKPAKCSCGKAMTFKYVTFSKTTEKPTFWRVDVCHCGNTAHTKITKKQYLYNFKINNPND